MLLSHLMKMYYFNVVFFRKRTSSTYSLGRVNGAFSSIYIFKTNEKLFLKDLWLSDIFYNMKVKMML